MVKMDVFENELAAPKTLDEAVIADVLNVISCVEDGIDGKPLGRVLATENCHGLLKIIDGIGVMIHQSHQVLEQMRRNGAGQEDIADGSPFFLMGIDWAKDCFWVSGVLINENDKVYHDIVIGLESDAEMIAELCNVELRKLLEVEEE